MTCGWLTGPLGNFLTGETGELHAPVPSYLIDHPRGKVVFDTGLHVDTQKSPEDRLGALARVYRVAFRRGEELAARLAALDIDVGEIRYLVNSHLHFDHTGGNAQLPNATLVVQRREWEAGRAGELIAANGYDPKDYDLGHELLAIDGWHDLFGDGRVVCLPTYGHTPGHQALRVRLDSGDGDGDGDGDVVLAADACYLRRTLDALHLPRIAHDREQMLQSLRMLRGLRDSGTRIFYGHDPEFWSTVPQAPHEVQ
jgi:N-acyl homoserine lactone hydrolase